MLICRRCLVEEVNGVTERSGAVMVALPDGRLLIHGGECLGHFFGDCFVSSSPVQSSVGVSFTEIATCGSEAECVGPHPRANHSLLTLHTTLPRLILFGGMSCSEEGETVYYNDVWVLTNNALNAVPAVTTSQVEERMTWEWARLPVVEGSLAPSPRSLCAAVSLSSQVEVSYAEGDMKSHTLMESQERNGSASAIRGDILIYGGYGLDEVITEAVFDGDENDVKDGHSNNNVEKDNTTMSLDDVSVEIISETSKLEIGDHSHRVSDSQNSIVNRKDDSAADDEIESNIVEDYLSDCWLLDSSTGKFCEVSLWDTSLKPVGGSTFAMLGLHDGILFGGFNGSQYEGTLAAFDVSQIGSD